jgi:hypothetical protein
MAGISLYEEAWIKCRGVRAGGFLFGLQEVSLNFILRNEKALFEI